MSLVLDASAALAWMFERADPGAVALADRLLDDVATQSVWVPRPWQLEVAHALLTAERRGVAKAAQVIGYLQRLSRLPIIPDEAEVPHRQAIIMALGRQFQLSACDATSLERALRTGSTLATFGTNLATAMQHAGGRTYPERQ